MGLCRQLRSPASIFLGYGNRHICPHLEKDVKPGAGVEAPNTPYWPGMIVIFMNGIFALLYSSVVGQWIHRTSPQRCSLGVALWFVSGVFYVPFYLREGFMLSGIHPLAWLTSLKVHIIYGLFVGWIAPIAN